MPFKIRTNLRTALLVMLAGIIACLAYGLYQRFSTGQERLHHDTRRIEAMLSENNAKQP
jgi:hypothetical protein